MDQIKKLKLNNTISYAATEALVVISIVALGTIVIPNLPRFPGEPSMRRAFAATWNFACTTMWIIILRVQAVNRLLDDIERKKIRRTVTPWVKFWFGASILIGSATFLYIFWTFIFGSGGSIFFEFLAFASVVAWLILVVLSLDLLRMKSPDGKLLPYLKHSKILHNHLLVPASVMFFLASFLFPIFFML
ncbi:MAG: hypothetical protein AB1476_02705 [Candidatus Hadarchaeota archaeon]